MVQPKATGFYKIRPDQQRFLQTLRVSFCINHRLACTTLTFWIIAATCAKKSKIQHFVTLQLCLNIYHRQLHDTHRHSSLKDIALNFIKPQLHDFELTKSAQPLFLPHTKIICGLTAKKS